MIHELERGSFAYIKKKKKRQLLLVFLMLLIGVVMFMVGMFMNQFERSNLCTMLAILMVLPATKFLVIYIVLFPYKTVSKARYDLVKEKINDNCILMTDMVITSPDKSMNLDFVVFTDNQVLCLLGKAKQDIKYIEKYLKDTLVNNRIDGFTVKVYSDEKQFLNNLPERQFEKTAVQEEAFKIIRTLVV